MEARLKKYISDPIATVIVTAVTGNAVYVIGQARQARPARIMNPTINVLQALSMAGGANPYAKLDSILRIRSTPGGQRLCRSRTARSARARICPSNVDLESGDVVLFLDRVQQCIAAKPDSVDTLPIAAAAFRGAAQGEMYYQPIISVSAEADSNLDLDPGIKQWMEGYIAVRHHYRYCLAELDTIIKPRIIYREYPPKIVRTIGWRHTWISIAITERSAQLHAVR